MFRVAHRRIATKIQIVGQQKPQGQATRQVIRNVVYQSELAPFFAKVRAAFVALPVVIAGCVGYTEIIDQVLIPTQMYPVFASLCLLAPAVGFHMTRYHVAAIETLSTGQALKRVTGQTHFPTDMRLRFTLSSVFNQQKQVVCRVSDLKFQPKWFNRLWSGTDLDGKTYYFHMDPFVMRNDPVVLHPLWNQVRQQTSSKDLDQIKFLSRLVYADEIAGTQEQLLDREKVKDLQKKSIWAYIGLGSLFVASVAYQRYLENK